MELTRGFRIRIIYQNGLELKLKNSGNSPLKVLAGLSSNEGNLLKLKTEILLDGRAAVKTVLKVQRRPWKLAFYGQKSGETAGQVWDQKLSLN